MQNSNETRRDFLRKMTSAGALTLVRLSPLALTSCASRNTGKIGDVSYAYRTFSVSHLPELNSHIEKLKAEDKISHHEVFRSYIDHRDFSIPPDFQDAKSVIMIATFTPLLFATFHHQGVAHELMLPPGYFYYPPKEEILLKTIQEEIIGKPGFKLARANTILQKTAAARCGLSEYGRNNIAYVKGMGSYLTLYSYFTDAVFDEDHWQEARMLKACRDCDICIEACPNQCIGKDNFVINVGKCTTLYNEIGGEFPDFIPADAHNAIMGCMHCQLSCPENQKVFEKAEYLEAVSEEETQHILNNDVDETLAKAIGAKLKGFGGSTGYYPTFTRNLKVLL